MTNDKPVYIFTISQYKCILAYYWSFLLYGVIYFIMCKFTLIFDLSSSSMVLDTTLDELSMWWWEGRGGSEGGLGTFVLL